MIEYFVSELGIFSKNHVYDETKEPNQEYVNKVLALEFPIKEALAA